jgi:tungstate transport system ATP-binding protein
MGDAKIRLAMFPIHIKQLRFTPNGRAVLAGIDLNLGGEGISVILGPNGSGKSVLMRMLAGLERPDGGSITWKGNGSPTGQIAVVFQHPLLLRSSVAANVALGLKPKGLSRSEVNNRVGEMLARVGLTHRAADSARLLSGGERQRLTLARAWAVRPRLLLLDEPTAALDPTATGVVEQLVREIRTDGAKIVMTTHNLGQAMRISDDIVFIEAGRVREHTPSARFFSRPQSHEARLFIQGELPWRISFDD